VTSRPAVPGSTPLVQQLFAPLPSRYDALSELLSLGQDPRWRSAMLDRVILAAPRRVLDVACGTAKVTIDLVEHTAAQVVGLDLTWEMVSRGREKIESAGLGARIEFVAGDARRLPFPDSSFDVLTFTYLLRYVDDPQATLDELARVVRPGGMMASLDFAVPRSRFWRLGWWAYTRWLLPIAGLMTGGREWARVGRFLGPNISEHYRHYPIDWTVGAWRRAGFEDVGVRVMSLGGGLVMWGRRANG
jgi:demethylmenaquinone methyltransferase / 2-methoxy-6-polyprenyl-1,4-benzoquinol methylase